MPTCVCNCGAKYKFAEQSIGKLARCRKCGRNVKLAPGGSTALPPKTGQPQSHSEPPPPPAIDPIIEVEEDADEILTSSGHTESRGFWRSYGWSLLFPSSPHNIKVFLSVWLLFSVISFVPTPRISVFRFIMIPMLLAACWFAAFRINTAEGAATGGFDLPEIELSTDIIGDFLEPAFRWYVSWFLALLPAIIYSTNRIYSGVNVIGKTYDALESVLTLGLAPPPADAMLIVLIALRGTRVLRSGQRFCAGVYGKKKSASAFSARQRNVTYVKNDNRNLHRKQS